MKTTSNLSFSDFWLSYPKRAGANPKHTAHQKYLAAVASGIEPERIINSAKAYALEARNEKIVGTRFVCQAVTWLNQKRWDDYAADPERIESDVKLDVDMKRRGWLWNGQKWEKTNYDQPET